MALEDFDPALFESRDAGDKQVYVKFYIKPVKNDSKSDLEGRPIYDDREYVEIRVPGDQNNVVQRPVGQMDKDRFPRAYRQFKEGVEEQMTGTPLSEMPWITRSQVEELGHLRIRSVEMLADLNDGVCTKYPGTFKLKQTAQRYLEHAKQHAPLAHFQSQLDELKNAREADQQTIADQSEVIRQLQAQLAAK